MPRTTQLVEKAMGKPLPPWIALLKTLKAKPAQVGYSDLEDFLGVPRSALKSVLLSLLKPELYEVRDGHLQAFFSASELKQIGAEYDSGLRYRAKTKQEQS